MLLPLLKAHPGFSLAAACARSGLTVRAAVENDGFAKGTTDYRELVADPSVDVVYVATRHDLHYAVARAAVEAGKAVFVEKPMTMTVADARALVELVARRGTLLTVGFNRRFSPHAARLSELLRPIAAPKTLVYRVNAGALPPEHWLLDPRRAADGCSARASTSSTCCAFSRERSRCASSRSLPVGAHATRGRS